MESPLGEDPILSTMESGPKPRMVGLSRSCPYGLNNQITTNAEDWIAEMLDDGCHEVALLPG